MILGPGAAVGFGATAADEPIGAFSEPTLKEARDCLPVEGFTVTVMVFVTCVVLWMITAEGRANTVLSTEGWFDWEDCTRV
jgi:hypothetical protein